MQNSSLFVVTRYTRAGHQEGHLYLTSVVVLLIELLKMGICLGLILFGTGSVDRMASELRRHVWEARSESLRLGVPAACYALQNNLIFVAISNLSGLVAGGARRVDVSKEAARQHRRCRWRRRGNASRSGGTG